MPENGKWNPASGAPAQIAGGEGSSGRSPKAGDARDRLRRSAGSWCCAKPTRCWTYLNSAPKKWARPWTRRLKSFLTLSLRSPITGTWPLHNATHLQTDCGSQPGSAAMILVRPGRGTSLRNAAALTPDSLHSWQHPPPPAPNMRKNPESLAGFVGMRNVKRPNRWNRNACSVHARTCPNEQGERLS